MEYNLVSCEPIGEGNYVIKVERVLSALEKLRGVKGGKEIFHGTGSTWYDSYSDRVDFDLEVTLLKLWGSAPISS